MIRGGNFYNVKICSRVRYVIEHIFSFRKEINERRHREKEISKTILRELQRVKRESHYVTFLHRQEHLPQIQITGSIEKSCGNNKIFRKIPLNL